MKRAVILLGLMGIVLACSQAVFAADNFASVKTVFTPTGDSTAPGIKGWVMVQPIKDSPDVLVTVQIYKGVANSPYYIVNSAGDQLGSFTTDKRGNGFWVNAVDPTLLGQYMGIEDFSFNLVLYAEGIQG